MMRFIATIAFYTKDLSAPSGKKRIRHSDIIAEAVIEIINGAIITTIAAPIHSLIEARILHIISISDGTLIPANIDWQIEGISGSTIIGDAIAIPDAAPAIAPIGEPIIASIGTPILSPIGAASIASIGGPSIIG